MIENLGATLHVEPKRARRAMPAAKLARKPQKRSAAKHRRISA
jgi:hypothetical protein